MTIPGAAIRAKDRIVFAENYQKQRLFLRCHNPTLGSKYVPCSHYK